MTNGESQDDKFEALRREIKVSVEGLHDHLKMVAEGAASQNEAVVRRLDDVQSSLEELRNDNQAQHKTLLRVLGDHEERITSLEQRRS